MSLPISLPRTSPTCSPCPVYFCWYFSLKYAHQSQFDWSARTRTTVKRIATTRIWSTRRASTRWSLSVRWRRIAKTGFITMIWPACRPRMICKYQFPLFYLLDFLTVPWKTGDQLSSLSLLITTLCLGHVDQIGWWNIFNGDSSLVICKWNRLQFTNLKTKLELCLFLSTIKHNLDSDPVSNKLGMNRLMKAVHRMLLITLN